LGHDDLGDEMSEHKARFINRQYIVNRKLQLTIILYSLILAVIVSGINFAFHYFLIHQPAHLSNETLLIIFFSVITAIYLVAVFAGFILTNRFAGPIFRLKSHMEEVVEGKTSTPLNFRESDYFLELIIPYNKIISRLDGPDKNQR
jgi:signal transduction histidine kinase